ncbi:hypothetical protein DICPUDRAFT_91418 [Dictyostelium purpureum]|uniref:C2H2-type domain-containing protein n=1 Tax=Dictyostelium purpureum TaxID=5786 RepID=F0ZC28_DICPU|nr:uncharacterized protein DICPUDRAFT_91418 [Dictyostelium purpureum]EGC38500.1 hypothetical protein DICPUDRAFT_91418 [Dictyostelium purpureum]|eukprot:XP_003284965.1 hypothetical protein DICPUDRAFT_91418 [Dictyostelium purpureum]
MAQRSKLENSSDSTALSLFVLPPDEKIFFCDHIGCKRGFSSPQSRSNHYSLKHSTQCENSSECIQCRRILKIKSSPKSKCRHYGCEKICSSANLAKHEKTQHHKHNYLEKFSCQKCDDLSSHCQNNYFLPSISDLTQK